MTADDYDQLTVDHAIAGYRVPLTRTERIEAIAQLTGAGWSASELAARFGITRQTVLRDRRDWTPRPDPEPAAADPYTGHFDDPQIRAAAARFIGAVHDLDNVWEQTADICHEDLRVLAIVCAAACDPDKPINTLLGWLDQLSHLDGQVPA